MSNNYIMRNGKKFFGGGKTDAANMTINNSSLQICTGNSVQSAINELDSAVVRAQQQANEANTIAKGKNRSHIFQTTADMEAWLSNHENIGKYEVGDNIYIVDVNVPDWWVSEVLTTRDSDTGYYYKIAQLETQKVDLGPINQKLIDLQNQINALPTITYGNTMPEIVTGKDGDVFLLILEGDEE